MSSEVRTDVLDVDNADGEGAQEKHRNAQNCRQQNWSRGRNILEWRHISDQRDGRRMISSFDIIQDDMCPNIES